jgi:hypothetical protein
VKVRLVIVLINKRACLDSAEDHELPMATGEARLRSVAPRLKQNFLYYYQIFTVGAPPGARNRHPHGWMGHHVHKITGHIDTAHRAQQGKWQAGSSFPRKESIFHSWPAWKEKSLCSRAYSLLRCFVLRARGSMLTHPS